MSIRVLTPRQLVAVDDARLVHLDDGLFRERRLLPLAHERMREQRLQIRRRGAFCLDAVRLKAKRDRRVEAIGDRKCAAKIIAVAAESTPRFMPDRLDAFELRAQRSVPWPHGDLRG